MLFPDDYWLIDFTTIDTNKKSNFHSFLWLFSTFTFVLFLYKDFGRKCFDKTTTLIHIPYIFQLVHFTQFSKPFHLRINSYCWYIKRLARYLLFTYPITKLLFIKPALRDFKVIQIRIVLKIFDIHRFFFKQWATYIDPRSFAF